MGLIQNSKLKTQNSKLLNSMLSSEALNQINAHRQTINLPELHLSYLEWNQGREPSLLLHGLADGGIVWVSLAEFLADRYHIIAPDLR
ncbi:MAG: hypothetical protein ICV63_02285, partial [Coleofasciculus sp. Co-bin14]|nr:hypothetical protein [Coleofasciculus sp. Co-bin14]